MNFLITVLFGVYGTCTIGWPVTNFLESITFRTIGWPITNFLGVHHLPYCWTADHKFLGTLSPSVLLNDRSEIPWDYHFLYSSQLRKNHAIDRYIFNKSEGYEVKAKIGKAYRFGPVFFEPNLSINHLDKNHVDYYYGVRDFEVTQNRALYKGDSAINQSIGLSVSTPIFFGGFTQLAIDYTIYDSSITDSPLVDRDNNLSMRLLFSKFF